MDARRTSSTICDIDPLEQRFAIDTIPTLEELASYRVVFAMWYRYIEENTSDSFSGCRIVYQFDKLVKSLEVPRSIEKLLINCMEKVGKEMENWSRSFDIGSIDFNYKVKTLYNRHWDPRNCFWLPNGRLCYKKTIRKVLSERELTEVEKFIILCQYCFEDDIKKFALDSLPADFVESVDFNKNFLVYYWIRYLKNELHEIPLKSYNSVDFLMAASCDQKCFHALAYFWDRLNEADQITLAASKLSSDYHWSGSPSYYIQERVLSMMSFKQQLRLLSQIADKIILTFWILKSPESVFWAWRHSKDVMTGDQFCNLVTKVFAGHIFSCSENQEERLAMLIEIWDTAPVHLKNYAAEHIDNEIAKSLRVICDRSSLPPDMYKFLYKMLLVKDVDGRRKFMLKNAISLEAFIFDPRVMNDIVDLCLPNPDDQLRYRRTILHSSELKEDLARWLYYVEECYDDMDLKIACYTKNEEQAREYKKNFLVEFDGLNRAHFIFDPANWKALTEYIDKSFPNSAEALEVRKSFVMAFVRLAGNYWDPEDKYSEDEAFSREDLHYWNDVISFDEFTMFVEKLFAADELRKLKLTFLRSFERVIAVGYYWSFYDENYYRKFVMWCVDYDEQAFAKFKKDNIRAKYIFNGILNTLSREYNFIDYDNSVTCDFDRDLLTKVDDLLTWYFDGDVNKKTDYKKKRILNYERKAWGVITMVESMHGYGNEDDMDVFLKWAFEDDEEAVRKFKKDNGIFDDFSDEDDAGTGNDEHIEIDHQVLLQRLVTEMRKYW